MIPAVMESAGTINLSTFTPDFRAEASNTTSFSRHTPVTALRDGSVDNEMIDFRYRLAVQLHIDLARAR
jgi:hypothetical protein